MPHLTRLAFSPSWLLSLPSHSICAYPPRSPAAFSPTACPLPVHPPRPSLLRRTPFVHPRLCSPPASNRRLLTPLAALHSVVLHLCIRAPITRRLSTPPLADLLSVVLRQSRSDHPLPPAACPPSSPLPSPSYSICVSPLRSPARFRVGPPLAAARLPTAPARLHRPRITARPPWPSRCSHTPQLPAAQGPIGHPPRLKSFLEKTLIAHARPPFSPPQRLHSLLTRTPAHPAEALPA